MSENILEKINRIDKYLNCLKEVSLIYETGIHMKDDEQFLFTQTQHQIRTLNHIKCDSIKMLYHSGYKNNNDEFNKFLIIYNNYHEIF